MYAMLAICPDLTFTVKTLSKYTTALGQMHWIVLKQVYQYLHETSDKCLVHNKGKSPKVLEHIDTDWVGDMNDWQIIIDYMFTMSRGAMSWLLKKQNLVALSSTEAEYVVTTAATKKAV